jgi:fluoride exporter
MLFGAEKVTGKSDSFTLYLLAVFLGGGIGALARGGLGALVGRLLEQPFPFGTLAVNLSGCFFIGLLWGLSETFAFPTEVRALLFTGFLGAFTTFSTFGLESTRLILNGEWGAAALYIFASNLLGLGLVRVGHFCARLVEQAR